MNTKELVDRMRACPSGWFLDRDERAKLVALIDAGRACRDAHCEPEGGIVRSHTVFAYDEAEGA